eukprot:g5354.t1
MPAAPATTTPVTAPSTASEAAAGVAIMDVGCGTGQFLEFIRNDEFGGTLPASLRFVGLDYMQDSLDICRRKFDDGDLPADRISWEHVDVVEAAVAGAAGAIADLPEVDYVTINGMFLAKAHLSREDMMALVKQVVRLLWAKARRGLAINVFHDVVDFKKPHFLYVPMDTWVSFVRNDLEMAQCSFRCDYGMYEYTVYIYRVAHAAHK